jgi:hypothetical protein
MIMYVDHGQDGCVETEGALMGASRQVTASGYVANGKTANPQTGYPAPHAGRLRSSRADDVPRTSKSGLPDPPVTY